MLKKLIAGGVTALLALTLAAPTASADSRNRSKPANVVDALVAKSSANGPDRNVYDFDLLIAAASNVTAPDGTLVATILAETGDLTVWAPRDYAFFLLARELGYQGGYDEGAVGEFLLTNVDNATLFTVLAYHVTPESLNVFEVFRQRTYPTLAGQDLTRRFLSLQDADDSDRDPRLTLPLNIETANDSVIHTLDRVLRPIDLP
ncbi:MAG TPA: fasciclin domain-containing protein [Acidimicrobiales bacterium]|nr:fasciclin domain-containing protein [Acidimicrobiales bacterium]